VNWAALAAVAVILLFSAGANAAGVRKPWAYGAIGLVLWGAVLSSGIHATVAGVLLAMTIPVRTRIHETAFLDDARQTLNNFQQAAELTANDADMSALSNAHHHTALEELEQLVDDARPPLIRMEHALHGIVAFAIMPLFALANAGVSLNSSALSGAIANPITIGAMAGLVLGKPLGITGFAWLAVRLGIASLPSGVTWRMLSGAGILGGIGFTMALFIAGLAFDDPRLLDAAKVGVLAASTIAGFGGWLWLRTTRRL
jgi:NhaA family Na+:H+ antiporter